MKKACDLNKEKVSSTGILNNVSSYRERHDTSLTSLTALVHLKIQGTHAQTKPSPASPKNHASYKIFEELHRMFAQHVPY